MYHQNIINNTYSNSKQLYRLTDQVLGRVKIKSTQTLLVEYYLTNILTFSMTSWMLFVTK